MPSIRSFGIFFLSQLKYVIKFVKVEYIITVKITKKAIYLAAALIYTIRYCHNIIMKI